MGPARDAWSIALHAGGRSLAVSPDGSTLAVAERSGSILLVDAAEGRDPASPCPAADDTSPVESLAFSPDGRTLAVGSRDQIRLWAVDGTPQAHRPAPRPPGARPLPGLRR